MGEALPLPQGINNDEEEQRIRLVRRQAATRRQAAKRKMRVRRAAVAGVVAASATLGIGLAKSGPEKEQGIRTSQKYESVIPEKQQKSEKINAHSCLIEHPEFIEKINRNMSTYKKVAKKYNVPWEYLAGLNYRESNFGQKDSGNRQGPFQIYLMPEGYKNLDRTKFEDSCALAAIVSQEKMGGKLTQETEGLDIISQAAGLYNGWEKCCVEEARGKGLPPGKWHRFKSYGWANFNEDYKNMRMQLYDNQPNITGIDPRYGVVKVFFDLKQAFYNEDGLLNADQ